MVSEKTETKVFTPTVYPHLQREGPDYIIVWPDLRLRFYKLHETSSGYAAVLDATSSLLTGKGRCYNSEIRLLSETSKRTAGHTIDERCRDAGALWIAKDRIEQACEMVINNVELGEPIVDLADESISVVQPPWLLEPFMRVGENAFLYGMGGTGKSALAMFFAVCLANNDTRFFPTALPVKIMYLDYEDESALQAWRLDMLCRGLGADKPHILYKRADASLHSIADSLARQIARESVDFLIIDSAIMACGGEPEKAEPTVNFFRAIRSLKLPAGSLTIGHHAKGEGGEKTPYGNITWWNEMRRIWYAKANADRQGPTLDVGLIAKKANNGAFEPPMAFHFDFLGTGTFVTQQEIGEVTDLRTQLSTRDRIVAALRENSHMNTNISRESLYEDLNQEAPVTRHTFNVTLKRMMDKAEIGLSGSFIFLQTQQPKSEPEYDPF